MNITDVEKFSFCFSLKPIWYNFGKTVSHNLAWRQFLDAKGSPVGE
jgi:hypothetical protein